MPDKQPNEVERDLEQHRDSLRFMAQAAAQPGLAGKAGSLRCRSAHALEGERVHRSVPWPDHCRITRLAPADPRPHPGQRRPRSRPRRRDRGRERSLEQSPDDSYAGLGAYLVAEQSSPSQRAVRDEQALLVTRALTALPDAQREALMLKYCQGWSLAEIGRHLDRSPTAVASLLQRGLKQLRVYLRDSE